MDKKTRGNLYQKAIDLLINEDFTYNIVELIDIFETFEKNNVSGPHLTELKNDFIEKTVRYADIDDVRLVIDSGFDVGIKSLVDALDAKRIDVVALILEKLGMIKNEN